MKPKLIFHSVAIIPQLNKAEQKNQKTSHEKSIKVEKSKMNDHYYAIYSDKKILKFNSLDHKK